MKYNSPVLEIKILGFPIMLKLDGQIIKEIQKMTIQYQIRFDSALKFMLPLFGFVFVFLLHIKPTK